MSSFECLVISFITIVAAIGLWQSEDELPGVGWEAIALVAIQIIAFFL